MGERHLSPFDVASKAELPRALPRDEEPASPCSACAVRHLSVCAALDADELHHLAAIVANVELEPGQPLFDEGEPASDVFNLTAGTIKVYKLLPDGRCQITGFLSAGDFLGLANQETYAFSAEAVTAATVCRFPKRKLEELMARFPKMEHRLLAMAKHELAAAQDQMLLLGRKTAKERIASFLLLLSRNAARRGAKSDPVALPMTRTDIGEYLGLTTETVSRTFTQLRKSGVIETEANRLVHLVDRSALEELAEGF